MRYQIVFFLLFFFELNMHAQNNQIINPEYQSLYIDEYNNINGIRIDRIIKNNGETILKNFNTPRNTVNDDSACYNPFGASWVGKEIIIKENGDNIMFNKYNDTLLIKTNLQTDEEWTLFSKDDIKIKASVFEIKDSTFLGIQDSIKKIQLKYIGVPSEDINTLNFDKPIILSKNHGMLQIFNVYEFPYKDFDLTSYWSTYYNLFDMAMSKNGVNITAQHIFDFGHGDEIHIEEKYQPVGVYTKREKYEIHKILEVEYPVNLEGIVYKKEVIKKNITNYYGQEPVIHFYHDTIIDTTFFKSPANNKLNYFPKEGFHDNGQFSYMVMKYTDKYNGRYIKLTPGNIVLIDEGNGCLKIESITPGTGSDLYIEGLGGGYFIGNYDGFYEDHRDVVYFRKGDETWGEAFSLSEITGISEDIIDKVEFNIFPNPASKNQQIIIKLFSPSIFPSVEVKIYSYTGRLVKSISNIEYGTTSVTLSSTGLEAGVYYFSLVVDGRVVEMKKIILTK
jgi:hypothetical protein